MARPEGNNSRGPEILPRPTHLLELGSTVYIQTREGIWWASCILSGNSDIDPPLPVAMIGKKTTCGHQEPNTQAFIALADFTVYYPKRDRHASRQAGTELCTYPTGLTRIKRRKGK